MNIDAPDSLGMHAAAQRVPESTEAAILAAQDCALPEVRDPSVVLVDGRGPWRWYAEVVAAIAAPRAAATVVIAQFDALPRVPPGALTMRIHADGGRPVVSIDGVDVVLGPEVAHARVALGAACAAPLVLLGRLGLLDGVDPELDHAVAQLHRRRAALFADATHPAGRSRGSDGARLARRIGRMLPLVFGAGTAGALAARRWKQQCNVNAKVPAFASALPDLLHDEIAGWGQHGDVTRQVLCGVVLRHDNEPRDAATWFATLGDALDEALSSVHEVRAAGDGELAQLLDLAYVGDAVSLHLAAHLGVDPGPAPALAT